MPNDVKALVYEVEIRNSSEQGKAIVSGDRKFPKVLAYIPSYNDSIFATQIGANAMIQMSKNALLDEIANNSEAINFLISLFLLFLSFDRWVKIERDMHTILN